MNKSLLLGALESAKQTEPMFADTIGTLQNIDARVSGEVGGYIRQMTSMSFGTIIACLSKEDAWAGDQAVSEHSVVEEVLYSLKNFTLNQLQRGVRYSDWQECWGEFNTQLIAFSK